jgi:hypothetical protein
MVSANYEAYKSVMRQAYADGQITPEETAVLDTLRQSLNISSEEHDQIENEVKEEIAGGGGPSALSVSSNPEPGEPPAGEADEGDINVIRPGFNDDAIEHNSMESNNPGPDSGIDAAAPEPEIDAGAPAVDSIEELLKSGKASYHKNDFQSAIDFFDKALAMEPENSEALFFRKRSQSKLQESGGGDDAGKAAASSSSAPAADSSMMATGAAAAPAVPPGEMRGDPNCSSCNGSGTCRWCKATGGCYWCKGVGQCEKCKGTGVSKGQQCGACAGSGKCHSCKGSGKCYWCQGTGRCSKCNM